MRIENKTSRILLMRRLLASGAKFDQQRIMPYELSSSFVPTDWETIEINEVAPKKSEVMNYGNRRNPY